MNKVTHFLFYFLHLSISVRDGLEYLVKRPDDFVYSLDAYNNKKKTINDALTKDNPFLKFVESNGENGAKFKQGLQDYYDALYGENAQFLKIVDGKIVVDRTVSTKIFSMLITIKTTIYNIIKIHYNDPTIKDQIDDNFKKVIDEEEDFSETLSSWILLEYIFNDRFAAFNQAKRQSEGKDTIESNFIQSELNTLLGLYSLLMKTCKDGSRHVVLDLDIYSNEGIGIMTGKVKLEEGKKMEDKFKDILGHYYTIVSELEPKTKKDYEEMWKELVEFEKALNENSKETSKLN